MIDLVMLGVVRDLVAIFGVIVGFTYYILTVRDTQKNQRLQLDTRQAQLFMQLYNQFNTSEFNKANDDIFFSWNWTDYNDFMKKYGPETNMSAWSSWGAVFEYFHGVSVLVEQKLIDTHLVYELMSGPILRYWEKVEPIFKERRKHLSFPEAIDSVDNLAQEMIMIRDNKLSSKLQ